jgi:Spy/CpxP family protein refolding chaperone
MKQWNIKMFLLPVFILLMASSLDAVAQRGRGMGRMGGMQQVCPNIPNLTEEQRSEIMQLRTQHLSEMQSYRDQIDINRAQYRGLMRSGVSDMSAINSNIDEHERIRSQMAKKQADHLQTVRSHLTEEQRIWFDAAPRGGPAAGFGRGGAFRQGAGMGPGAWGGRGGRGAFCPYLPGGAGQNIMRNQPPFYRGF